MSQIISVIAYHGWGYDGSVWQGWQDWFTGQNHEFCAFDRGYFGSASAPIWPNRPILLVHSYGLHWAMRDWATQQFPPIAALVCFGSFQSFHPEGRLRTRSQKIVQQMIDQFAQHPAQVLQNFWAKSAHPADWLANWPAAVPDHLNCELLLQDLQDLNQSELAPLPAIPQVWMIQGAADRIVASTRAQDLAAKLGAEYLEIAAAGHALPFTHAETCQAKLKDWLQDSQFTA